MVDIYVVVVVCYFVDVIHFVFIHTVYQVVIKVVVCGGLNGSWTPEPCVYFENGMWQPLKDTKYPRCNIDCDITSRSYFVKMNSTLGSVVPLAMLNNIVVYFN